MKKGKNFKKEGKKKEGKKVEKRKELKEKKVIEEVDEMQEETNPEEEKLNREIDEIDEAGREGGINIKEDNNTEDDQTSEVGGEEESSEPNASTSTNSDGVGTKDPIYKALLEKNKKLKDRIEAVAGYIYQYDKMYFYFSDEGKETWIERNYPEVKSKRKLIVKKVDKLFKKDSEA